MAEPDKSSPPNVVSTDLILCIHLLDAASDALAVTDADGGILICNARFLELWRLPTDGKKKTRANLGETAVSQLDSAPGFLSLLKEKFVAGREGRSFSLQFTDGREVAGFCRSCLLKDGAMIKLWRFQDGAAVRKREADLEQEREWFRVTLSSIGDAVITTDVVAQVTFLNPVAEKMTGWSDEEARGQPLTRVFNIINELTRTPAVNPVSRVLAEGAVIGLANHTSLIARDGHETAIEDSAAPIRDAAGKVVGTVMVFHDVDARRKAERALQRSEKLLADFFSNAPVGLNWIGADGKILRVNRAELEMLDCMESNYVGRPWTEFHDDPNLAEDILRTLISGKSVENRSARMRRRDGSLREVLISANTYWENDHFAHARCFTRDVTEQNRAEAARAHLAALVTSSEDAIISKSLEGVIKSWNQGAERIFGYSAHEAVGKPITLVIPADRLEEEPAILERLKRGERVDHFETVRQRKDGTLLDVSLTISPIRDAQGVIVGASKIARDITSQKRAERAVRAEHGVTEQLNLVAQALATELDLNRIVQIITDAATRITRAQFGAFFYNRVDEQGESYTLYTLSGVDRAAFEKFPMPRATALFGPTFRGEGVIRLADVRQDPRFGRNEPHHGMPAGHLPVVSYLAVPVIARSGEVLGGLFFGHPQPGVFTERDEKIIVAVAAQAATAMFTAELYEAEKKARAAAESASETKDHFIATLSHELRTPLTPVLAILSSLRDHPDLPAVVSADLETARRNVLLEARLIDDLLDLTRISRGKLALQEEVFFVEAVVETAVNTCRPDLEGRELELVRDLRASSAAVAGDGARLTQVLWNILKNAIKFTPDGGTITIRSRLQHHDGSDKVMIEVQDTGVGIEAKVLPRIFSAFDQGGDEITRQFGGLGLGLAISQAIVQAHRGELVASSPGRGKGSTFTVTLPVTAQHGLTEKTQPFESPGSTTKAGGMGLRTRPLRILLVEDHHDTAMILKRILASWGHTVWHATTVAEALRLAETEMNNEQGLDLVISDLGLSDGSGLEIMHTLSQKYRLTGIALSGYGMESDLKESMAAGFTQHLTKPLDMSQLRAALYEVSAVKKFS